MMLQWCSRYSSPFPSTCLLHPPPPPLPSPSPEAVDYTVYFVQKFTTVAADGTLNGRMQVGQGSWSRRLVLILILILVQRPHAGRHGGHGLSGVHRRNHRPDGLNPHGRVKVSDESALDFEPSTEISQCFIHMQVGHYPHLLPPHLRHHRVLAARWTDADAGGALTGGTPAR